MATSLRAHYDAWICQAPHEYPTSAGLSRHLRVSCCLPAIVLLDVGHGITDHAAFIWGITAIALIVSLMLMLFSIRRRLRGALEDAARLAERETATNNEREFADTLLDSIAPDILFVMDATTHLLRCNDALLTLFDWPREKLLGQTIARFFADEEDYLAVIPLLALQTLEVRGRRFEHTFWTRARQPIRMEAHITWIAALGVFVIVARDTTSRYALEHRLETALYESEQARSELMTVFDTVQDAIIVYDAEFHEVRRNEAFKQLFPAEDTAERPTFTDWDYVTTDGDVLLPDQIPLVRVLRANAPSLSQTLALYRDGREVMIVQSHVAPLYTAQGVLHGALSVIRDVTDEMRNVRSVAIMQAVSHACATAADEQSVAQAAIEALTLVLKIPNGTIVLRDRERPKYGCILGNVAADQLQRSSYFERFTNTLIEPSAPFVSLSVIATGEPIFDRQHVGAPQANGQPGKVVNIACSIPLIFDGAVMGALTLTHPDVRSLNQMHIYVDPELIQAVADEIATSLHRARLYEDARRLALYDPLTGLRNHRALQDCLQQELTTGALRSLPVSLIMLDVDHFRKFNEQYGHDVGDRALRIVAQAIQSAIRDCDVAGRYGGEEFTVVLPAVDTQHAEEIAERIRATIAAHPIHIGTTEVALTASLGYATFPVHASAPASLLKAADLALYAAKRLGRDKSVAYTSTLLQDVPRPLTPLVIGGTNEQQELSLPTGADLDAVQALITAIDLRDGYTAAHSDGVSRYAVAIATEMGLPTEYIETLRLGALIHDVGKIGIPDQVLRKPGRLTEEEWVMMRAHTTMGEAILQPVTQLRHLLPLVRWHHERLDGSGYPDGLRGDQIAPLVRILSVADVFEAYTAERPYHPGRPATDGMRLLKEEVTLGHLDGDIVCAFETLMLCQGLIDGDIDEAA